MALPQRARAWLEDVADTAVRTAKRALAGRNPSRTVMTGASGSPTSALDRTVEKAITKKLDDAPFPVNLASEEIGIVQRRADWWLIADPVDGTRNALHGIPFYCVSLALGQRDLNGIEFGIVRSIPYGTTYWAERGKGATRDGKPIHTRRMDPDEVLLAAALDYEDNLRLPGGRSVHMRDLGSAALEMCLVAQGSLDGFFSTQELIRVVDIAASTLILREAGGHVFGLDKKPLNVPFDVRRKFPLIAVGDARVWPVIR